MHLQFNQETEKITSNYLMRCHEQFNIHINDITVGREIADNWRRADQYSPIAVGQSF